MNQKNNSFSIHFTILLANHSGINSRKRPKTVMEPELRFFWNQNRHNPNGKCKNLVYYVTRRNGNPTMESEIIKKRSANSALQRL